MALIDILLKGDVSFVNELSRRRSSKCCELYTRHALDIEKLVDPGKQITRYVHIPRIVSVGETSADFTLAEDGKVGDASQEVLVNLCNYISNNPQFFEGKKSFGGIVVHPDLDCCNVLEKSRKAYLDTACQRLIEVISKIDPKILLLIENNPLYPTLIGRNEAVCRTPGEAYDILSRISGDSDRVGFVLDIEHAYKTALSLPIYDTVLDLFRRKSPREASEEAARIFKAHIKDTDITHKANGLIAEFLQKLSGNLSLLHVSGYDPLADDLSEGRYYGSHLPPGYSGASLKENSPSSLEVNDMIDHGFYAEKCELLSNPIDIVLEFDYPKDCNNLRLAFNSLKKYKEMIKKPKTDYYQIKHPNILV